MNCTTAEQDLQALLRAGETLGQPEIIDGETSQYEVYPVVSREPDITGNTVIWHVPRDTEKIHVIGSLEMQMEAVAGAGEIVVYGARGERRIQEVAPGLGRIAIGQGDTYQIFSASAAAPVAVRDRAEPAYRPGDEASLRQVSQADVQLRARANYLIWNPRQPGRSETAGAWWLTVLEEHDTTSYNMARAGISKFRGEPSHWHAAAQRVGESTVWPVNVQVVNGMINAIAHKQAAGMTIADIPTFPVQEDALVLQANQESI